MRYASCGAPSLTGMQQVEHEAVIALLAERVAGWFVAVLLAIGTTLTSLWSTYTERAGLALALNACGQPDREPDVVTVPFANPQACEYCHPRQYQE